ncbi:MAG: hypothetical protein ILO36_00235, partial [Abditibacteriota bacterium]|nr:hypothetical protein [Abditibacteriota bacterium]
SIFPGVTAMGNFYDREISYRFAKRRTAEMTATDKTSAGVTPRGGFCKNRRGPVLKSAVKTTIIIV